MRTLPCISAHVADVTTGTFAAAPFPFLLQCIRARGLKRTLVTLPGQSKVRLR